MRIYIVCLLISLLWLIEFLSYSDIIYLKNGKQVKGRIVEQIPEQLIETGDESILAYQMGEKGKVIPREKQVNKLTKVGAFVNRSIATSLAIYGPIIGIFPLISYPFPFQGCGQLLVCVKLYVKAGTTIPTFASLLF